MTAYATNIGRGGGGLRTTGYFFLYRYVNGYLPALALGQEFESYQASMFKRVCGSPQEDSGLENGITHRNFPVA